MSLKRANRAIDRKIFAMDQGEAGVMRSAQDLETQVLSEVFKFYDQLRDDIIGLDPSDASSKIATDVNRFQKSLTKRITSDKKYRSSLRDYTRVFTTVDDLNSQIHKNLSDVDISKVIEAVGPEKESVISQLTDDLVGQGMDRNFSEPVKRLLFQNLVVGAPRQNARKQIRDFIAGSPDKLGHLQRYTSQVTRDALNQYDGALNDAVRKQFKMNAFRYVGTILADQVSSTGNRTARTRAQCSRWLSDPKFQGIINFSDLEAEISWANANGSGMIAETTPETFGRRRGGFNCRHQAIPFRRKETKDKKELGPNEPKPLTTEEVKANTFQFTPHNKGRAQNFTFGEKFQDKIPGGFKDYDTQIPDQFWSTMPDGITMGEFDLKEEAWYDPFKRQMNIVRGDRWHKSEYGKRKVIVHEGGHAQHFFNKEADPFQVSKDMEALKKVGQKDIKKKHKVFQMADPETRPGSQTYTRLKKELVTDGDGSITSADFDEMWGGYADTVFSITNGQAGWGHDLEYIKKGKNKFFEIYAHASENYWVGNPVTERLLPEFYEASLRYIEPHTIR